MLCDNRVYNFSAGPAMMPAEVIEQAQNELPDWQGSGMSVMEMSHRGSDFSAIASGAESDLRRILGIPDHYRILFMQGGATSQFSMVPLNLLSTASEADYVNTGTWSTKAIYEARKYATVNICASAQPLGFRSVPDCCDWQLSRNAAYLHITPNETIGGLEFENLPDSGLVPIVADMSSTLLSRPIDVSRFGVIYAGAQKNIGPAGLSLVIIRDDLLDLARDDCPTMYHYRSFAEAGSMLNTPPTYAWYLSGLVFQWILRQGGLAAIGEINRRKASKLYRAIDDHDFYHNPVDTGFRSLMNIPFTLQRPELDAQFLVSAKEAGLLNLKGHRSAGGMRASIYNAMPEAGVDALIEFMHDFASVNAG